VQGTRDPAPWLTIPAALDYRRDNDWPSVQAHCQALAQDTAGRLAELTGLEPLSAPRFCAPQMVAMPIPECDTDQLKIDLIERYNIEIPVFKWQDRCIARLSVQGYNSKGQMDLLIDALTHLLKLNSGTARKAS
jgi:isopenicillin-N epimerase